jgi:lipopolysaccharide export system permease protein
VTRARRVVSGTLGRHLAREFLGAFAFALAAFVAIYLVAYFFDRLDTFLKHDASLGAMTRYFLFQIPFVVSQVTPFAMLMAALVGLGLLARQNEFVAMRACGVSIWQMAVPLFALGAVMCVATFFWGEFVVPWSAQRWHTIENVEIRKRGTTKIFTGQDVWVHGRAGFYNIERVSRRRHALYGLTVYQLDGSFVPVRMVEVDLAAWDGAQWRFDGTRTRVLGPQGLRIRDGVPAGFSLPETFDDFSAVAIEPEELSWAMLRRQIRDLRRKGVDTLENRVELHLKVALPAAGLVMMLLAVPLAAQGTRRSSLASSLGLGFALGFLYFVVVATAVAVGKAGRMPPALAAWSANLLFGLVGGYLLLGADDARG